jgi:hypothetical protein
LKGAVPVLASFGLAIAIVGGMIWNDYKQDSAALAPYLADEIIARSFTEAQKLAADAEPSSVEVTHIDPDGRVLPQEGGFVALWFNSPSHPPPNRKPSVPGAPPLRGPACPAIHALSHLRKINRSRRYEFTTQWTDDAHCYPSLRGPLRCTIADLWKRAIADGAPNPSHADFRLETENGKRKWRFQVVDRVDHVTLFERSYADDCR